MEIRRPSIFLLLFIFMASAASCAQKSMGGGGHGIYPDIQLLERIQNATAVIKAQVVGVLPSRWDTPDGKRPDSVEDHFIYTDVKVNVLHVFKGPLHTGEIITIRFLGGKVDDYAMTVEYQVPLYEGEIAYLMLSPHHKVPGVWEIGFRGKMSEVSPGKLANGVETISIDELIALSK